MKAVLSQTRIRSLARWALLLFILAWVNLAVQAPVHAAMKQNRSLPCHCDTTLCDTVLTLEQQSDDALGFVITDLTGFQIAFVSLNPIEPVAMMVRQGFHHATLDFRQYRPPPLLLKTTLLI